MAPPTVRDLMDQRGKHQFAMLRVETLDEAEAAAKAGVELLSVPPSMVMDRRLKWRRTPSPFRATTSMKSAAPMISSAGPSRCTSTAPTPSIAPALSQPSGQWPTTGSRSAAMSA